MWYLRLLPFILFIFLHIPNYSQSIYCKTDLKEKDLEWLRNYQESPSDFSIDANRQTMSYVPVKVHIVGDNNGDGYYSLEYLLNSICNLNEDYASMNIYFYLWGEINYINNSNYYDHNAFYGGVMFSAHNFTNMLNVYFVNDPNGACGYYTPAFDAIAIRKSCQTSDDNTLTHEVGHYFSMPHTFYGWESGTPSLSDQEKVIRTGPGANCSQTADGFCDTGSDYLAYIWGTSNCNSPVLYDPDSVAFQADPTNFMSYAYDICQNDFSSEQEAAIISNLVSQRPYLLNYTEPQNFNAPQVVNIIEPLDGETGIPYNWVALQWDTVSGANTYHVMLTETPSFASSLIDTIVSTSYLITELEEDESYRWKVKALFDGNTCAPYNCTTFDCPEFTVGAYSHIAELEKSDILYDPLIRRLIISGNESSLDLKCFDLMGRLVYENKMKTRSLSIPENLNGYLVFVVRSEDRLLTKQIFIE